MAPHSSTLAWKIPWTEKPGRLQSMGSLRVGHNWATSLSLFTFIHWRRKWQLTPVFLPGEFHGQRSLAAYSLCSHTESDTTELLGTYIQSSLWYFWAFHPLLQQPERKSAGSPSFVNIHLTNISVLCNISLSHEAGMDLWWKILELIDLCELRSKTTQKWWTQQTPGFTKS